MYTVATVITEITIPTTMPAISALLRTLFDVIPTVGRLVAYIGIVTQV